MSCRNRSCDGQLGRVSGLSRSYLVNNQVLSGECNLCLSLENTEAGSMVTEFEGYADMICSWNTLVSAVSRSLSQVS
jgi:hypothetical protein